MTIQSWELGDTYTFFTITPALTGASAERQLLVGECSPLIISKTKRRCETDVVISESAWIYQAMFFSTIVHPFFYGPPPVATPRQDYFLI